MIAVNQKGLLYLISAVLPYLLTAAADGLREVADIVNISEQPDRSRRTCRLGRRGHRLW
jgi:hypothetical protein